MNRLLREAAFGSSFQADEQLGEGEEGESKPSIGGKADGGTGGDTELGLGETDMSSMLRRALRSSTGRSA
jgi:hypothetical protein